jgi:thiamine monophosphate synthase
LLAREDARYDAPWALFALGGVRVEHVSELVQAGAAGVAVIREVFDAAQPARAILALLRALTAARSS